MLHLYLTSQRLEFDALACIATLKASKIPNLWLEEVLKAVLPISWHFIARQWISYIIKMAGDWSVIRKKMQPPQPYTCSLPPISYIYSRCQPTITLLQHAEVTYFFAFSCFRWFLGFSRQQELSPSEPVYYASFRLFKTSLVRVNIISGRASRFRKGMHPTFSVIILWDDYFIITLLLYLFIVTDIGVVCFLCNPLPCPPWESHPRLDTRVTGRLTGVDKWTEKFLISPGDCNNHWWDDVLMVGIQ